MSKPPLLIIGGHPALERILARLNRGRAISAAALAPEIREADLARVPARAWCEGREQDIRVLQHIRDDRWRAIVERRATAESADAELLDRLMQQIFIMEWGRKLDAIRVFVAVTDLPVVRLACDLPPPLRSALVSEFGERVVPAPLGSVPLRVVRAARDFAAQAARHLTRLYRVFSTWRLASPPERRPRYASWLHLLPSEASGAPDTLSVPEYLAEARASVPGELEQIVVQGAPPSSPGPSIVHRKHLPAVRYRPNLAAILRAVVEQCRQLVRMTWSFDFRSRSLADRAVIDLPAFRLWFRTDPPAGVMYPNHVIGSEPPVALLRHRFGVPTTMVFYSTNMAYPFSPRSSAEVLTRIHPEFRRVIADRLTMWSPEMTQGFRDAGYAADRLPLTGPIVFGRRSSSKPASEGIPTDGKRPVRIGVFDVSVISARARFEDGYGLLVYNSDYACRFFSEIGAAAQAQWNGDAVIVRKLKRKLTDRHHEDVPSTCFGTIAMVVRDPAENLWRVLEHVDAVVCMPFTSVAYVADCVGLPAAYYDPSASVERSPTCGRAPLLLGRAMLAAWFAELRVHAAPRIPVDEPGSGNLLSIACRALSTARPVGSQPVSTHEAVAAPRS